MKTKSIVQQLAALAILGVSTLTGLQAQTVTVRATIPFDFAVGSAVLPSGEYEIHNDRKLAAFRKLDGKPANAFVTTLGTVDKDGKGVSRLEFHRYGSEYFLSAIWTGVSANGFTVAKPNREKELAKRAAAPIEAMIVARKR